MKKIKIHLYIVTFFLFLCSCNNSSSSKAATQGKTTYNEKPMFQCKNKNTDLSCLEEACSYAGGIFSQELKKCSCGVGENFAIEQSEPRCAKINLTNTCLDSKGGFNKTLNETEDFNNNCGGFSGSEVDNLYIDFSNATDKDRVIFADWADNQLRNEFNYNFWHTADPLSKRIFIGGTINDSAFINGLLKPYNLPDENTDYLYTIDLSPLYFANSTDAIYFLKNQTKKSSLQNTIESLKEEHPNAAKLLSAYETMPTQLNYQTESRYKEGCLRSCIAKSESVDFLDNKVWYEKFYIHGTLYRNELRLADKSGMIMATLILADNSVSMAIELNRDQTGLLITAVGFDSYGKKLFTKNVTNLSDLKSEQAVPKKSAKDVDLKIALCEDNISSNDLIANKIENAVLQGDNKNNFNGWGASNLPQDYWLTRLNLNEFGAIDLGGNSEHATKTASVLLKNNIDSLSVGLFPLGITVCTNTNLITKFWNNILATETRVINLSATDEMDFETCNTQMTNHPLLTAPKDALWIAAAGNGGNNKRIGCPQHMFGLENLIIVAANQGQRIHPKSNYGLKVADIAAPGEDSTGNSWGTSFSTPRVSRLAAKIFKLYPQLTPFQVKKAILLGAQIPDSPLPVLSKGILNEENSVLIAKGISNSEKMNDILKSVFCKNHSLFCTHLNTKMKINIELNQQGGYND